MFTIVGYSYSEIMYTSKYLVNVGIHDDKAASKQRSRLRWRNAILMNAMKHTMWSFGSFSPTLSFR